MKGSTLLIALAISAYAPRAIAQDIIKDVDYVSGRDGLSEQKSGMLLLSSDGIRFVDRDGKEILNLPIAIVTDAVEQSDIRDASFGKKMLFGGFAGTRKQEFLTVSTETSEKAEAIIFKLKQHTAAGAVTKIKFYKKHSGTGPGADSTKTAAASHPVPLP